MDADDAVTRFSFEATVIYWRGPAPFFYAPVPAAEAEAVRELAKVVSYGWGCVPVEAEVGGARFTTSLFPKDGGYLLPLKAAVRRKTEITAGDAVAVEMTIQAARR
jgi:hypothetical protein